MAGKNQVTLTFAGDSTKLESAFAKVGESARTMQGEVGKASATVAASEDSFDRAAEGADNAEGKAQGFASTLTGTKDLMSATGEIAKGNYFDGLVMAGQGAADLAEGLNYTVIPAVKAVAKGFIGQSVATVRATATAGAHRVGMIAGAVATNVMTVAQKGLNLAMRMNPIGLIITALFLLGAGLVLAYRKSSTFRAVVQAAMRGVQTAFGWVVTAGQKVFAFFKKIGPGVAGALKGVASTITAPFRIAFEGIRSLWNNTIGGKGFSFPGFDPPGPGSLPGFSFTIPRFHTGTIVSGAMGSETLAVLQAGERVTAGRNSDNGDALAGDTYVYVTIDGQQLQGRITKTIRQHDRDLKRDVKAA